MKKICILTLSLLTSPIIQSFANCNDDFQQMIHSIPTTYSDCCNIFNESGASGYIWTGMSTRNLTTEPVKGSKIPNCSAPVALQVQAPTPLFGGGGSNLVRPNPVRLHWQQGNWGNTLTCGPLDDPTPSSLCST